MSKDGRESGDSVFPSYPLNQPFPEFVVFVLFSPLSFSALMHVVTREDSATSLTLLLMIPAELAGAKRTAAPASGTLGP